MDPNAPPPYQAVEHPQVKATDGVTIIQTQPTYGSFPIVFADVPVTFTDAQGKQVQTQLEYRIGGMTWIVVMIVLILGMMFLFPLLCICIPCCMKSTRDVYHINPNDGSIVGIYRRMS
ncbi:uncharacterized protein LOC135331154 [Halichondria panicea]|uniref:uncharacterized protein LOC135331154 n=1 Tax=Halichondria panicea TaxID=6063 RepID=UPI00312B7005